MKKIAVVGAGFSGAVIARELAEKGYVVNVFDSRTHIAGNCHTERDRNTGIMIHKYGPHIFHTNNQTVWDYVNKYDEFMPFINRVKSIYNGKVYSLPVNLLTINNFFGKNLSPKEASSFINSLAINEIDTPKSFEDQALKFVGRELYEAFFKGYTSKQWGVSPSELPASILKRLPLRFNYDDNYYNSKFQGIPKNGYTYLIEKILSHDNISVSLSSKVDRHSLNGYAHIFNSGPIDCWYQYEIGQLGYRTLEFLEETHDGDYQGNAVINYSNESIPWTRISEHKHFAPWESHEKTVIYKEYSRSCGINEIPYYPLRLVNEKAMLKKYIHMAESDNNISFVGRLGTYRYLDMHITIQEALETARSFIDLQNRNLKIPAFFFNPIGE